MLKWFWLAIIVVIIMITIIDSSLIAFVEIRTETLYEIHITNEIQLYQHFFFFCSCDLSGVILIGFSSVDCSAC